MKIPTDKIREVIGTGGKVIREIVEKTGAKINIEDDGTVKIASSNGKEIEAAIKWIHIIVAEPEVGEIYEGTVVKTADFGAFVNFFGPRTAWSTSASSPSERVQDHRRGQGRRQGLGQAARLRRARQGPPVDEGRRPGATGKERRPPTETGDREEPRRALCVDGSQR
jgi:polyribonucleotide nucleotidyltransferase